jgi:type VI secretion system secreted protein Hcp
MALDMFIKLEGIKGDGGDPQGADCDSIRVVSWTWGMTQTGAARDASGLGMTKANVNDLSFSKDVDISTPDLMLHCCHAKPITRALLTCRRTGPKDGPGRFEFVRIELDDCMVTSVSTGAGGTEGWLTEHVTLNFQSYHVTYTKQGEDSTPGATSQGEYRVAR